MKVQNYILAAAILASATSCHFLDEELKGGFTADTYYTTDSRAQMAVNAVYNSLYDNTLWIFGDVASDDAVKGGNAGDQAEINSIDDFTASGDNGVLSTFWINSYETISRANNVIANVPGMNLENGERYVAEATFLRCYAYFNLINIFGPVPYKTKPQNERAAIHVALSPVESIYSELDKDLVSAAAKLPEAYDAADAGRVTKGAALALLAKIRLFQADWNGCLNAITQFEAITEATYGLEPVYANLFKEGAEDSMESIFSIRYVRSTSAIKGNNLTVWLSPSHEGGYYFDAPTQEYVSCFDENTVGGDTDPRLDASIGRDGQPWFNGETFQSTWSEATGYLVKKYNQDLSEEYAKSESTIPQHILRYADLLLMKAEALNESSGVGVQAPLNQVRGRAGLGETPATTQADLRDAIRKERRRELGFEFHRFFDVMRYGNTYASSVLPTLPSASPRFYYPIPQAETDANEALQN